MQNQKVYSVYIIEDEYYSGDRIKRYVNSREELELKGFADEADKALKDLKKEKYDLLFLDINLEGSSLTGFDILEELDDPPFIIYTTGHREYAGDVFEASCNQPRYSTIFSHTKIRFEI